MSVMKKILGLLLLVFAFVSCENETDTNSPGMQAMANNEEFTAGFKYEVWRPDRIDAFVANESVLYLIGQTDSTAFTIRVPYRLEQGKTTMIELGDVIEETTEEGDLVKSGVKSSNNDEAYAIYTVRDNVDKTILATYKTNDISNRGVVVLDKMEDQIPGTISGTFYVNLKKFPGKDKLTTEQQIKYDKVLRDVKSFQDGYFFRIPMETAK